MKLTPNMLAVPGVCLATYGLWLLHPSLGFLGFGVMLVFVGVWMQRNQQKDKPQ